MNTEDLNKELCKRVEDVLHTMSLEQYESIRDLYNIDILYPELQIIYNEILQCITFGFYIAAITLTNHLLEQFLKKLLTYHDSKREVKNTGEDFEIVNEIKRSAEKFRENTLGKNIELAFNAGLITSQEKNILNEMKDDFRNAYSHADTGKLYKDESAVIEEIKDPNIVLEGKKGPMSEELLMNLPIFEFLFIRRHAEANCIPYIRALINIILKSMSRLKEKEDSEE